MKISDASIAKKFLSLRRSAYKRHLEFDLSLLSVRNLLSAKRCYYTNALMTDIEADRLQRTIDRIDNTKGYVKGNVVACCLEINHKKGALSLEEIKYISKALR